MSTLRLCSSISLVVAILSISLLSKVISSFSQPQASFLFVKCNHWHRNNCRPSNEAAKTSIYALTERQMQFWEDVEDGLDEIESAYEGEGLGLERIRDFVKSASGAIPPPTGYAPHHLPSEEHVPGLTARPFWDVTSDPARFPWAAALEANSHLVVAELRSKLSREEEEEEERARTADLFSGDSAWQNDVMGTGWSAFRLRRLGVWNEGNCGEFPETAELLKGLDIPFAVRGVCFARQRAGSEVEPHSDGRNFILTSHLGLMVPEGCWMEAAKERRTWEVGKLTTLDTSFEHSVGNPTDSDRHVLIIDFWHPDLTKAEIEGLEVVYDLRNKFESGEVPVRTPRSVLAKRKEAQEGLGGGGGFGGILNSLFGGGDKK